MQPVPIKPLEKSPTSPKPRDEEQAAWQRALDHHFPKDK